MNKRKLGVRQKQIKDCILENGKEWKGKIWLNTSSIESLVRPAGRVAVIYACLNRSEIFQRINIYNNPDEVKELRKILNAPKACTFWGVEKEVKWIL